MRRKREYTYLLFILPAVVWVGVFTLYPFFRAISISLTDMNLLRPNNVRGVGLQNYARLLSDELFRERVRITLVFTAVVIFFQFTIGFGLALLLNCKRIGTSSVRTVVMLPWILPPVALGIVWAWIFRGGQSGLLNAFLLQAFGTAPIRWLGVEMALPSVIVATIWIGTPFSFMLELAGLQKIPTELYEAADVDGASAAQRLAFITIPLMRATFTVNWIMITVFTISYFDIIYAHTRGGPQGATEVLPLFMYLLAFRDFQFGRGAAVAGIMLVISLLLTLLYLLITQRRNDGA